MTIVLREVSREAADAILAGERPHDLRVAGDYPTEFSEGMARAVGSERQFGSFFLQRSEDDLVVGEIGGAFIDEEGTLEIGYAVVESQRNRGYATEAVAALVREGACVLPGASRRRARLSTAPKAAGLPKRQASRWRERRMTRTRRATSCASRSGSWRSSSAAR